MDGGVDAGPRPEDLFGIAFTDYRVDGGIVAVAEDVVTWGLQAWTHDGIAFSPTSITYPAPGEFVVRASEGETIYVEWDTVWFVTRSRTLDLSSDRVGRPDATPLGPGDVNVSVSLTDSQAWATGDWLDVISAEAGATGYVEFSTPPTNGATSISTSGVFVSTGAAVEVEPLRGDTVYALHFGALAHPDLGWYSTVLSSAHLSNVELTASSTASLSGSLTAPLQNALTLDVRFSQFAALATKMHPQAFPRYTWINIAPNVHGYSRGSDWFSPYVFDAYTLPPITTNLTTSAALGDPFPADWDRLAEVWMGFGRPLSLPGTFGGMATASIRVRVPASELANGVVPVIEPVQSITIDGRSGTQPQTVSALTPVISWQPPSLGNAAGYFVTIEEAYAENGWTLTTWVAQLLTEETNLNVPPGVFAHGKSYNITISAVADSAWRPAGNQGVGGVASAFCELVTVE